MAVYQSPQESISPASEQIRPVPESILKQNLRDSSDDRNRTNLSSAASQFVTQLVADYEAAKYESYWGRRYTAKGRVGLGTNDEAQTTSDAALNQPQPESISPASEKVRPVSELTNQQLLHDASDDRNRTNLSPEAYTFLTQLVGDYEGAKYESYWGRRYAAKGRVGLETNDEAQTTSDAAVNQFPPE